MNPDDKNKNFDELIKGAIGRDGLKFDFNKWKDEHKKEVQIYKSQKTEQNKRFVPIYKVGRIIMKSPIAKFAAAAVIIIVAGLLLFSNNTIVPTAYAITDTIEAYNSVSSLHIKENVIIWGMTSETWIECDIYGNIHRMRYHSPRFGDPIGPLTIVGNPDQSQVWLALFNIHLVGYNPPGDPSGLFGFDVAQIDPKRLIENLYQEQDFGLIILDINEPVQKDIPITITVTYPEGSISENWMKVFYVDQATKLVKKIEKFELRGEEYQHIKTIEFSDYNQQFDPVIFSLDQEVSENAMVFDMTNIPIGLEQGDMTNEEVATEITRQFWEAVITKDYNRAGQLFLGVPGFLVQAAFMAKGMNVFELSSVGPSRPDPDPDSNAMISSSKCLFERGGQNYIFTWREAFVRPVSSGADKWVLCLTTGSEEPVSDIK